MPRFQPTAMFLLAAISALLFSTPLAFSDEPQKAPGLGAPGKLTAIAVESGRMKDGGFRHDF